MINTYWVAKNVNLIHPNVKGVSTDLTKTKKLSENLGVAFTGVQPSGPFHVSGDLARKWLTRPINVHSHSNATILYLSVVITFNTNGSVN
jgi:hypothetical protein